MYSIFCFWFFFLRVAQKQKKVIVTDMHQIWFKLIFFSGRAVPEEKSAGATVFVAILVLTIIIAGPSYCHISIVLSHLFCSTWDGCVCCFETRHPMHLMC